MGEALEKRNQEAKQAMEEWEQTTAPEDVVQEVIIESVDDATKIATLVEDERQLKIPDDMLDDLKAKLQQIAEIPEEEKTDQRLQSQVEVVEDEVAKQLGIPKEPTLVPKSFTIIGGPSAAEGAAGDAAAADPEAAAEPEA